MHLCLHLPNTTHFQHVPSDYIPPKSFYTSLSVPAIPKMPFCIAKEKNLVTGKSNDIDCIRMNLVQS